MKPYNVDFKPSVEKDFKALPKKIISRIMKKIEELANNPFPRNVIKLSSTEYLYRIPVGVYRIIYEVDTHNRKILIHYVRHRREAYRGI
ncbi:MAG: mRNA interferase RelE/StbE [Candidatus Poribacteria bacterium]|nr:mRNA interferase RelE/StbE [Candidatus Poribacteria bacterium]